MKFQKFWFLMVVVVFTTKCAHSYERPPPRETLVVSLAEGVDPTTPQQVHVSLAGEDRMRITWITDAYTPPTVHYGTSAGKYDQSANGNVSSYEYLTYTSGDIHDVVIGPLNPSTVYYYCFNPGSAPEYSFKTPPGQFPIKFAVSGDLGQTGWTKTTLEHISQSNYDILLLPGDLSYADALQHRWDSFGRLVEPLASQRPWMVTQGNHEVEKIPVIHKTPFTAYNARWRMPFEESGSTSNLYYSFEVSGVHVIMLGSYTDCESGSDQYQWLESDINKVDRSKTPWLVVLIHAPWYNSNTAHQGEKEPVDMMDLERERFLAEIVEAEREKAAQFIILGDFNMEYDEKHKFLLKEWRFEHQEDGKFKNILIRGNNSVIEFFHLEEVLEVLDRYDLEDLHSAVKEYYKESEPHGGETVLIEVLDSLFSNEIDESGIWDSQDDWEAIEWKYFESCGVHVVYMMNGFILYMAAEKKYPLKKKIWEEMLKIKMEVKTINSEAILIMHRILLGMAAME